MSMELIENFFFKFIQAKACLCGDEQSPIPIGILKKIGFSVNHNDRFTLEVYFGLCPRLGNIIQIKNNICLRNCLPATFHSKMFHMVGTMTQTSGIDKAESDATESKRFLNSVASGTRDITDYGAVIIE